MEACLQQLLGELEALRALEILLPALHSTGTPRIGRVRAGGFGCVRYSAVLGI